MIRLCTCTGGSSSPVDYKHREAPKTCRSCGGNLSLDGRGALSTSMSTVGLELSSVIDPQLNWKTTSKGRQRAVRRARSSLTRVSKNSASRISEESVSVTNKDLERTTSNMAVSEFEKLSVSVLGQRFSDSPTTVPIKKRRFLRSPSPPHQSSSDSDTDQIQERESAGCGEAASNTGRHTFDINSCAEIESGQERSILDEKPHLEDVKEKLCDAADFSGISILAAAACDSNTGGDVMNDEETVPSEPKPEEEDGHTHSKEVLNGKTETPPEIPTTLVMPSEKSEVVKVDGSCSLGTSTRSLLKVPDKLTRLESSSRDARLHWDLNTVMDAWESPSSDILSSEPLENNLIGENLGDEEPQVVSANSTCASKRTNTRDSDYVQAENCASEEIKMQGITDFSGKTSVADPDRPPNQEDHIMGDSSVSMLAISDEVNKMYEQDKMVLTAAVPSPLRGPPLSACYSCVGTIAVGGEKGETCCAGFGSVVQTEVVHEALTIATADLDEHSVHCCPIDVDMVQSTKLRSPRAEKHDSLHISLENDITVQSSVANILARETSGVMIQGDISKDTMGTSDISGEITHTDAIKHSACGSPGKFKEESKDSFTLETHVLCSPGSVHDKLTGCSYDGELELMDVDTRMQDNKCSLQMEMDKTEKSAEDESNIPSNSDFAICSSAITKPVMIAVPSLDGALNAYEGYKSQAGGCDTHAGQISLGDQSDFDYYSDVTPEDTNQLTGMEKVDFLRDEEYQYEDGEFRESSVIRWGEDDLDDGETEHVDYESDNREADAFEDESNFNASVSLHIDDIEGKTGLPATNCDVKYGEQARKEMQDADSVLLMNCSPDGGPAKRTEDWSRELEMDTEVAVSDGVGTDIVGGEFLNGVASMKSSHLPSYRVKSSGWDRLPEGSRSSESGAIASGVDLGCRSTDALFGTPNAVEPFRRVEGSSPRRDMASRAVRPKFPDASYRQEKLYARASRPNDHRNLDSRVEREADSRRTIGRGGSSLHIHGRGKRERWVDSPNHCGPNLHDSRGFYGPASSRHPPSKNAAAAMVAKLESNGYVVAADGTIIKAGGVRPVGQVPRRSTKESPLSVRHSVMGRRSSTYRDGTLSTPSEIGSSREMSPLRHISVDHDRTTAGRYGHEMANTGRRESYNRSVLDDSRDAPLPLHHQLSRREKSISPRRRPLHQSHSRSPLRSRTRSPRMHTPTPIRGRNDLDMNAGPASRLRSRSPQFKSQVRTQRQRSYYQSDLTDHMADYSPSSRNLNSPDHFREQVPNRFSDRNPPGRVFLKNKRLDRMDSPGSAKSTEYHQPMHSGAFPEFVDFDRGYNGPDDERRAGNGNRYEMLHSGRQYNTDGNTKHFRYDAVNDFRGHNVRPGRSEFQRRASPRGFDKSTANQRVGSPRRLREENVNVRFIRHGNQNSGVKSFGVPDRGDDVTPQRR